MTCKLTKQRTATLSLALVAASACFAAPRPRSGPPALGLDGRATFQHYLDTIPAHLKMRHQVDTRFVDQSEVVEGFCVVARPEQFWIRATTPMGGTLFDVRSAQGGGVQVETSLEQLKDARGPLYLARDIRRIYLKECPADAALLPMREGFRVSCPLAATEIPIQADDGPDKPDDAMALLISEGGVVWEKTFYRGGVATAQISYDDYQQAHGLWLPQRITLTSLGAPYTLTIALISADPTFDTTRIFGAQ